VIFAAAMRLLDREMKDAGRTEQRAYWHAHATRDGAPLLDELWAVIDHVKAHSTGGLTSEGNLVTACNKCNGRKNSAPLDKWGNREIRKPIKGTDPEHWDGFSGVFVMFAIKNPAGLSASEKGWLKVLTAETSANPE
jgi:hypothetical protein